VKHQAEKNIAKGIAAAAKQRGEPDLSDFSSLRICPNKIQQITFIASQT